MTTSMIAPPTTTPVSLTGFQTIFPKAEAWSTKAVQEDGITIIIVRRYHKRYTATKDKKGRLSNVVKDSLRELKDRTIAAFITPYGAGPYPVEVRSATMGEEFSGPGPNPTYFRHAYAEIRVALLP